MKHIRFDWAIRLLRKKANFGLLEGFLSELLKEDVTTSEILERPVEVIVDYCRTLGQKGIEVWSSKDIIWLRLKLCFL